MLLNGFLSYICRHTKEKMGGGEDVKEFEESNLISLKSSDELVAKKYFEHNLGYEGGR